MTVYISNLVIHTGTDFEQVFVLESEASNGALNLNGYTGCAQLKKYEKSISSGSFTVDFTNRQLGKVKISMASTVTEELKPGKYFYDLLLNDGDSIQRVVEGTVLVKKTVTQI
jgi:hypothetical protein